MAKTETRRPQGARRQAAERSGRRAEALAALLLRLKLYRVLARRFKTPVGEIDLIVRRGDVVAFVEVKHRTGGGEALEAVTATAQRRIARAAEAWLQRHPAGPRATLRFDVVVVTPGRLPRHHRGMFLARR